MDRLASLVGYIAGRGMMIRCSFLAVLLFCTRCAWSADNFGAPSRNNMAGLKPSHYRLQSLVLERPGASFVFMAERVSDKARCAIKMIDKRYLADKDDRVVRADREVDALSCMSDRRFIVDMWHTMQDDNFAYIVTEFIEGVDLHRLLDSVRYNY